MPLKVSNYPPPLWLTVGFWFVAVSLAVLLLALFWAVLARRRARSLRSESIRPGKALSGPKLGKVEASISSVPAAFKA
jgi:cytochrome c-type biogenesis protein CcmH/NrfF